MVFVKNLRESVNSTSSVSAYDNRTAPSQMMRLGSIKGKAMANCSHKVVSYGGKASYHC